LDERLRAAGIEYLLIVGTATNICCESTARDAMMRNFRPIIISDATATRSDQEQVSALINVLQSFGCLFHKRDVEFADIVIVFVFADTCVFGREATVEFSTIGHKSAGRS